MQVVAEGVETPQQMEFLDSRSCDIVQGNFISKPVRAAEMTVLLERQAGAGASPGIDALSLRSNNVH